MNWKRFLSQKDPQTGVKNGRLGSSRDQHMAHEVNRNGKYYCDRLVEWILEQRLPFDLLYYYWVDRPIHINYGRWHMQVV